MHSVKLYSAILAAGAGVASAASATCTTDILITQATPTITCDVVNANIKVDEGVTGDLSIEGPKQLKGDLIISNATKLISISSTSINSIEGSFQLVNLELLSSVKMQSLKSLKTITLQKLPQLSALTFGTSGVTKASSIEVTDTFLSDLSGLNVNTVDTLQITNNHKLTMFNSDLVNITTLLSISSNGNNMQINMTELQTAAEIQLSNIKGFDVPNLSKVTKSLKFDLNPELTSFEAKNLSSIGDSVTFTNNTKLANISFPILTKVGDLTIQNNPALEAIDGFPELQTIYGGVILRGSFDTVKLPSLKDVKGGVTVSSTTNIDSFCSFFDDAKKHGAIQGSEKCTSNNTKANEGGDGGSTGHGSTGGTKDSGVSTTVFNMGFVLGLTVLAGVAQLL
ncbi:Protein ecm33 [Cladobotryum mycophilum]|uniref:Protein ecm33 n=1 Tax=Cladobotryum mycophilum TaxID=491253 RepID=A0ABR0SJQ5_9HYPO